MKRKEKHDSKVSEGEGMKKGQPNKKESLNSTSTEQRGSQMKIKLLGRLGFEREFHKVTNLQQLGKRTNKTKSNMDELQQLGKQTNKTKSNKDKLSS